MGRSVSLVLVPVYVLVLVGCGEEPEWVGTYAATGTWKLDGPFSKGRTVGEATAELLVDEVASALPAPSFVEDKVRDWLEGAVGEVVRTTVDGNVPADLAPGGKLNLLLGQTLAAVQVESTIVLSGDDDELEGSESVTAVSYTINGQPHRVAAAQLGGGEPSIGAEWRGGGGDSSLSIDPHSVALRYGELVRLVAGDLLQASELSVLEADLSAALSCKTIVAAIGGGSGLQISVVGWKHTVSAADLEKLCASAMALAEQKALGQFELDTKVEVGGTVLWSKEIEAEGETIQLQSGPDFGGVVNVVPKAFAPKVDVSFTAQRQ